MNTVKYFKIHLMIIKHYSYSQFLNSKLPGSKVLSIRSDKLKPELPAVAFMIGSGSETVWGFSLLFSVLCVKTSKSVERN